MVPRPLQKLGGNSQHTFLLCSQCNTHSLGSIVL